MLFFTGAAAVCVLLLGVSPSDFRWLCWLVACVYLVLALASGLDSWSRNRTVRTPHPSFRHDTHPDTAAGTDVGTDVGTAADADAAGSAEHRP